MTSDQISQLSLKGKTQRSSGKATIKQDDENKPFKYKTQRPDKANNMNEIIYQDNKKRLSRNSGPLDNITEEQKFDHEMNELKKSLDPYQLKMKNVSPEPKLDQIGIDGSLRFSDIP